MKILIAAFISVSWIFFAHEEKECSERVSALLQETVLILREHVRTLRNQLLVTMILFILNLLLP